MNERTGHYLTEGLIMVKMQVKSHFKTLQISKTVDHYSSDLLINIVLNSSTRGCHA